MDGTLVLPKGGLVSWVPLFLLKPCVLVPLWGWSRLFPLWGRVLALLVESPRSSVADVGSHEPGAESWAGLERGGRDDSPVLPAVEGSRNTETQAGLADPNPDRDPEA